ncbi:unnamed protein product [Tilletia laevis]|nr:unnamed protein product [Tilletia laevis]
MSQVEGVRITGPVQGRHADLLTPEAVKFLAVLHRNFEATRQDLLRARAIRQTALDGGAMLNFLPETAHIRENATWQCAPPAP